MYEFRIISNSNMIAFCSLLIFLAAKFVLSSESAEKLYTGTCEIGDVVQNECIKCVCTHTKNVFECVKLNCTTDATNASIGRSLQNPQKPMCHSGSAYVLDVVTCLCSKNGTWPHSRCLSTFLALPPDNVTKEVCEPDSYVILDCNVCRCGSDGRITTDRCTKNLCDKDKFVIKRRQGDGLDPNSKCAPKNWYSFAPCQFCYCVNENKLVCNTGNRNEGKLLELGSYKLTVCGERLITDAQGLIPTTEKLLREGQKQYIPPYIQTTTKSQISADMEKHIAADLSDSDVKVMPNREGLSTQLPYEEEEEENDIDILSDETNENDDIPIKAEDPKPPPPVSATTAAAANSNQMDFYNLAKLIQQGQNMLRNSQNYVNNQNLNDQDMNFPQMLDKILSMALRKSMVKLEPGQECEPGSTKKINCNTCFCLVNGKLLCTDKECT